MTDIAHCSECGHTPEPAREHRRASFFVPWCSACGNCVPNEDAEWDTEAKANAAWNRHVLASLAAQERELSIRQPLFAFHECRALVVGRYVWLGQNPLSLPA